MNIEDVVKEEEVEEVEEVEFVEKEEDVTYISKEDVEEFAKIAGIDVSVFSGQYQNIVELSQVVVNERNKQVSIREATKAPEPKQVEEVKKEPDYDAFEEALTKINSEVF